MPKAKRFRFHLTRDSVHPADDIDAPHLKKVYLPGDITIEGIATWIVEKRYLPNIQGGTATWSLVSIRPIAILALQWDKPKMLRIFPDGLEGFDFANGVLRAHLYYHAQQDPDVAHEVLAASESVPSNFGGGTAALSPR